MNKESYGNILKNINPKSYQYKHLEEFIPYAIHKSIHNGRKQECPRCKSERYVKNGTFNGVQRYICKDCRKSFCEHTDTPWYYSKKAFIEWIKYYNDMIIKSSTLHVIAKDRNISLGTAFQWRHKILNFIKRYEETKILSKTIGISSIKMITNHCTNAQLSILLFEYPLIHFAMDGRNNVFVFSEKVDAHRGHKKPLITYNFKNKISEIFIWNRNYQPRNMEKNFKITVDFNNEYVKKVFKHTSKFRSWKARFRGIAFKYFNNYGYWSIIRSLGKSNNIIDYLSSII